LIGLLFKIENLSLLSFFLLSISGLFLFKPSFTGVRKRPLNSWPSAPLAPPLRRRFLAQLSFRPSAAQPRSLLPRSLTSGPHPSSPTSARPRQTRARPRLGAASRAVPGLARTTSRIVSNLLRLVPNLVLAVS
jgi:hypothetical protein